MHLHQPLNNQAVAKMLLFQAGWLVAGGLLFVLCWVNGISLGVPFLLLISAWFFKIGLQGSADASALERDSSSDFNHSSFQNGQWVAVKGALRPLIPGSDRALPGILAYYFRIFDLERSLGPRTTGATSSSISKKAATRRFDGFYLVPTGVSTPRGVVKLSGFPDLTGLEKNSVPDEIFTRGESQAEIGALWLPSYLQRVRLVGAITDQADKVIQYGDRKREGTDSGEYMSLQSGDEVCVFGRWQDGELLADKRRPRGLPVHKEPLEKLMHELKADARAFNAGGVFFLMISLGLVVWSYWPA